LDRNKAAVFSWKDIPVRLNTIRIECPLSYLNLNITKSHWQHLPKNQKANMLNMDLLHQVDFDLDNNFSMKSKFDEKDIQKMKKVLETFGSKFIESKGKWSLEYHKNNDEFTSMILQFEDE